MKKNDTEGRKQDKIKERKTEKMKKKKKQRRGELKVNREYNQVGGDRLSFTVSHKGVFCTGIHSIH